MRKAIVAALAAGVLTAGCVSVKNVPLESSSLSSIKGQPIAYTERAKVPDFSATKASNVAAGAIFGAIGGAAMAIKAINDGNELIKLNQIGDPAEIIAENLTKSLASSQSATPASAPVVVQNEDPAQIAANGAGARYIVDVRTTSWGTLYYSTDWSHYGLLYGAKLRLIDASSSKVVAEGFCFIKPEKTPGQQAPTYDELTANGAEKLKAMISAAVDQCTTKFKTETLKL